MIAGTPDMIAGTPNVIAGTLIMKAGSPRIPVLLRMQLQLRVSRTVFRTIKNMGIASLLLCLVSMLAACPPRNSYVLGFSATLATLSGRLLCTRNLPGGSP